MFCCFPDPGLASLLAGETETVPEGREALLALGVLTFQALAFLAAGAFPW
jgi:hypothetical protein